MDANSTVSFEFNKVCRLCLSHGGVMSTIFDEGILTKLQTFTSLQVKVCDGLPTLICVRCMRLVEQSYEFKQQCETSDAFLRQYISKQYVLCTATNSNNKKDGLTEVRNPVVNEDGKDIRSMGIHGSPYPLQLMLNNTFVEPIIMVVNPDESDYESPDEDKSPAGLGNSIAGARKKLPGNNVFGCNVCNKSFADSASLTAHVRLHLPANKKQFDCKMCPEKFATLKDLRQHENIHEDNFVCTICSKVFSRSTNLTKHMRVHSGVRPHACDQCPKTFQSKGDLVRHKFVHSGIKPFPCTVCSSGFSRKDKLNRHMKIHEAQAQENSSSPVDHLGEFATLVENYAKHSELIAQSKMNGKAQVMPDVSQNLQCGTCLKTFTDATTLKNHEKIHARKLKHVCGTCGKEFQRWRELFRHEQTHSGVRPFECEECGKRFSRKDKLLRHTRVHTERKHFKCDMCPKVFTEQDFLTKHRTTMHPPPNSWCCQTCGATFMVQADLVRHVQTHTKTKPYKCPHCKVSFYKKDKYSQHLRIHAVKNIACNLCSYTCSKKQSLDRHMKTHQASSEPIKTAMENLPAKIVNSVEENIEDKLRVVFNENNTSDSCEINLKEIKTEPGNAEVEDRLPKKEAIENSEGFADQNALS